MLLTGRADQQAQPRQFRQHGHVGLTGPHSRLTGQYRQELLNTRPFVQRQHTLHRQTQGLLHLCAQLTWLGPPHGEIQHQPGACATDPQRAGQAGEVDHLTRLVILLKQHMGRRQGGMTAQRHFSRWGKPADMPDRALLHHKRGFCQVMFGGNLLHQGII